MAKSTHIAFILDRSGSMSALWDEVKGGFKGFIEDQKKQGNPKFSLTVFDTEFTKVYDKVDLADVANNLPEDVFPRGSTALLDAVGQTVSSIGKAKKVMVVIFTDGYENSSHEYTKQQIKDLVKDRQDAGWGFLFLGADQDAFAEGSQWGMQRGQTVSFDSAVAGSSAGSIRLASNTTSSYLYQNKKVDVPDTFTPDQKKSKKVVAKS